MRLLLWCFYFNLYPVDFIFLSYLFSINGIGLGFSPQAWGFCVCKFVGLSKSTLFPTRVGFLADINGFKNRPSPFPHTRGVFERLNDIEYWSFPHMRGVFVNLLSGI